MSGKTPRALEEKPEPSECLQFYINAFLMLDQTRKNECRLALSDIFLYADTISEDRIEFAKIIIEGDRALLECRKDKAEN